MDCRNKSGNDSLDVVVIPAKAGIWLRWYATQKDPVFRRDDVCEVGELSPSREARRSAPSNRLRLPRGRWGVAASPMSGTPSRPKPYSPIRLRRMRDKSGFSLCFRLDSKLVFVLPNRILFAVRLRRTAALYAKELKHLNGSDHR